MGVSHWSNCGHKTATWLTPARLTCLGNFAGRLWVNFCRQPAIDFCDFSEAYSAGSVQGEIRNDFLPTGGHQNFYPHMAWVYRTEFTHRRRRPVVCELSKPKSNCHGWIRQLQLVNGVLWLVAVVLNSAVVFGLLSYTRGDQLPVDVRALYASLSRTIWALGVAWFIVACHYGYGGIMRAM